MPGVKCQLKLSDEFNGVKHLFHDAFGRTMSVEKLVARKTAKIVYQQIKDRLVRFHGDLLKEQKIVLTFSRSGSSFLIKLDADAETYDYLTACEYGLPGFPARPVYFPVLRALEFKIPKQVMQDKEIQKILLDGNYRGWKKQGD